MEDDKFGVLEAVTTWADIIHKLRIAVFDWVASVCMPACLHSLSHSQADKEISFVRPHTSVVGVIRWPLLPVTFPCGSVRCRKWGLHLPSPQLNTLVSLLANDRRGLGLQWQFGNPNMTWHNITQLSERFKHKCFRDATTARVCPRVAGSFISYYWALEPTSSFLSAFSLSTGSRVQFQRHISPTSHCM